MRKANNVIDRIKGENNVFNRDDYLSVKQLESDFGVSGSTVRRWIVKGYIAAKWIEVHAGQYYVHKDGANEWRAKLKETPILRGRSPKIGSVNLLAFIQ